MDKKKSKIVFIIALSVMLAAIIALSVYLLPHLLIPPKKPVVEAPSSSDATSSEVVLPDNPKNFTKLQKQNPDIHAWISIPGTNIDYPILQSGDDTPEDFYLNHGTNKKYLYAGSIYTQRRNSTDFSDPNTVIYGHNMKNGSMFGTLKKYRDVNYFNKNSVIYIYTPGHILTYTIYAAYRYDNRHLLYSFDFNDPEVFNDYLQMTLNPKTLIKNIRKGIELSSVDRIITLSTCMTSDDYRYLVQGVLINDQPTK
ncbi:MAG: class B sortase [Oscillospiraceae bacterium]|nr:class B sortase [Oscillospiraceae bacterium]